MNAPTIVIGLGNEYISDDGAGILAVRQLRAKLNSTPEVDIQELSVGGLQLLDYLIGRKRCILVDAVLNDGATAGTIYRFEQGAASGKPAPLVSSHQVNLPELLGLASILKADVPPTVTVYGIQAGDAATFGEGCTPAVAEAIPRLVDLILTDLETNNHHITAS
jgi:hydrogenase maturation protease